MKKAEQNKRVVAAIENLMLALAEERAKGTIDLNMWSLFIYDGERVVQRGAGCNCGVCHTAIALAASRRAQDALAADGAGGPDRHGVH
jgi:hypothetical protein